MTAARHWRHLAWRYPEWWSVALSVAAWAAILAFPHTGARPHHMHGPHAMAAMGPVGGAAVWTGELSRWLIMIVAMMFPLVLGSVRITAARSLWSRRHRAIAGFLVGYLGPWMLFGAGACAIVVGMRTRSWYNQGLMLEAGFGVALIWQFSRWKQRGLSSCHLTIPIAPAGWRADRDCLRYGWEVGGGCLLSCWALMLVCLLAGHGMIAMACGAVVGVAERARPKPDQLLICGGISVFLFLTFATASMR